MSPSCMPSSIQAVINKSHDRQTVVMMCGIAGSGKTTLSKQILEHFPSFQRLSIDEIVAECRGLVGIDFPLDEYTTCQDEADFVLVRRLAAILQAGVQNVVVDRSFWSRHAREEFRKLLKPYPVACILVYLKAPGKDFLRQRIVNRRMDGVDANSALDINEELLETYWTGFEPPCNEGEIVVELGQALIEK